MTPREPTDDETLDSRIVEYLEAEESEVGFDTAEWLKLQGNLRGRLSQFVESHRRLQQMAAPLRAVAETHRPAVAQTAGAAGGDLEFPRTFGSFELLECLGQGGMGTVYKARSRSPSRLVALKIARAGLLAHTENSRRFRHEADLVARLDHPGIVPIYEVGEDAGHLWYSMKLVEGGDLSRHLDRFRLNPRGAAGLIVSVAQAVHHAHERGVLHRDLKPSNILLDGDGAPHVADFGLARYLEPAAGGGAAALTHSGLLIGTPAYMAPEQTSGAGRPLTVSTDVYGLGSLLYALLTGQAPFAGGSTFDTLLLVSTADPLPPRQLNPGVDRDLETICLKCLQREPSRRYASAREVADDLSRWLAGEPIQARAAGRLERLGRYCRRQPIVASLSVLAGTLLVALLVGLSAAVILLRAEQARTRRQHVLTEHQAQLARERETAARRLLYAADINQAWRAFEASDLKRMAELVNRHIPLADQKDLRGFEWRYLNRLVRSREAVEEIGTLHNGRIFGIAYSPDGRHFATASEDRTVAVWDASAHARLFELRGFDDDANSVAFAPGGETLAASGEDGSIRTCDARDGSNATKVYQSPGPTPIPQIAFAPDGSLLAAACGDGAIRLFDWPSMQERTGLPGAHHQSAEAVRFAGNGATLISAGRDGTAKVWDTATLQLRHTFPNLGEVKSLDVARDRPLAAVCSYDGTVLVFNYETSAVVLRRSLPAGWLYSITFSADATQLAVADRKGSVRTIDVGGVRPDGFLPGRGEIVWSMTCPAEKTYVAADALGTVWKWEPATAQTCRQVVRDREPFLQVSLAAPPGKLAVLCLPRSEILLVDAASGAVQSGSGSVFPGEHPVVSFAETDQFWAVGRANGVVEVRRRGESEPRWQRTVHPGWINPLAIAADGVSLWSCCPREQVRRCDLATGTPLEAIRGFEEPCHTFALSPDRQTMALATFRRTGVIDCRSGRAMYELPHAEAIAFSRDGALLALSLGNSSIGIYDARTGANLQTLLGAPERAVSLAFSPDGRTLASGQGDVVRLWSVALGQELLAFDGVANVFTVMFSHDGNAVFAASRTPEGEGVVYAWDALPDE